MFKKTRSPVCSVGKTPSMINSLAFIRGGSGSRSEVPLRSVGGPGPRHGDGSLGERPAQTGLRSL